MNRTPKPCTCPLALHVHGTRTAYEQCGCRCYPCANASYAARKATREGQPLSPPRPRGVPAVGTRRRIEALHAIGWSSADIAALTGIDIRNIHIIRVHKTRISRTTAERIAAAYELLWDKRPVGVTRGQRTIAAKMRNLAARNGWLPPLAWDNIDDPDEHPDVTVLVPRARSREEQPDPPTIDEIAVQEAISGRAVPLTYAEKIEVVARMSAVVDKRTGKRRWNDAEIGRRIGMKRDAAAKIRERHIDGDGRGRVA